MPGATMRHSWLGFHLRRLGRIGIGFVSFVAGVVVFAAASLNNPLAAYVWSWRVCGAIGLSATVLVFTLFDTLGVVPDDSDPPTTLALSGASQVATRDLRS